MTESSAPTSPTNGSDDPDPDDHSGPGDATRAGSARARPAPARLHGIRGTGPAGADDTDDGAEADPTGTADRDPADPDPTGGVPAAAVGPAGTAGEHTDLRAVLEATRPDIAEADCPECGAGSERAAEGVCEQCGARRPAPRDHLEFRLGPAAALTDRGLRRRRNEDACALGRIATPDGELLVASVCDGVASARRGDEASLAAAEATVAAVLTRVVARGTTGLDGLAAVGAAAAADAAADLVRLGDPTDPPATTYTGAVTRGGSAVVSWVGDSRIYWLAADGTSQLLSTDDSWAEEIAAAGVMTREQAHADRRAHVLTRWLGYESPPGPARARRFRPAGPGVLLLCSDGLWNHVPEADRLAELVSGADTLADARALVDAALADGGFDNTTVAVVPLDPADGDGEWGPRDDGPDTGPILIPLDDDPDTGEHDLVDPGGGDRSS